jgi:hypothetical protein
VRIWIPLTLAAAALSSPSVATADVITLSPRKDATIYSDASDRANALGAGLFIGMNSNGFIRRTLIAFDLAGAIPAGSTINSVTLTLRATRVHGSAASADLHRLQGDWGEVFAFAADPGGNGTQAGDGDVTWTDRFFNQSQPWTNQGGDFNAAITSTTSVGSSGVNYTWPSTPQFVADAQSMLDTPGANFGWILIGNETVSGSAKRLASREYSDPTVRPKLTVTYTVPTPSALSLLAPAGVLAARRRRER